MAFIGWNEVGADIERARTEAERAVDLADTTTDAQVIAVSRFSLAFALLAKDYVTRSSTIDEPVHPLRSDDDRVGRKSPPEPAVGGYDEHAIHPVGDLR